MTVRGALEFSKFIAETSWIETLGTETENIYVYYLSSNFQTIKYDPILLNLLY